MCMQASESERVLVCTCMCTSRMQEIRLLEGTVDINLKLPVQTPQSGHLFRLKAHQTVSQDKMRQRRILYPTLKLLSN